MQLSVVMYWNKLLNIKHSFIFGEKSFKIYIFLKTVLKVAGALTAPRLAFVTIIHLAVMPSLANVSACLDGMDIAANKASRLKIQFFKLFDLIYMDSQELCTVLI